MSEIKHKKIRKTAIPRTGRVLDAGIAGSSRSSGGGATIIETPAPSFDLNANLNISQGLGVLVEKEAINTKVNYTISHGATSEVENTLNDNAYVIQNLEFDQFGHVLSMNSVNMSGLFDDRYLRKDIDDTAHGSISFDKYIKSSVFIDGFEGGKGWQITDIGAAMLDSARVRSDIFLGGHFGTLSFAPGFTGWGSDWDMPTNTLVTDNLFARKNATFYTITYSQVFGIGGSQITSDLNKIASVERLSDRFRCYMDDMDGLMLMNLRAGDGIRIQARTGTMSIKYLFGRCIGVTSDYFDIAIPLLEGSGEPEAGDFAMRWGNNQDITRQGLIYSTTSDDGAPFTAVYDGITGISTEGTLKVLYGNLSKVRTKNGTQLRGYGAYLNGIFVENSTIYLDGGLTVEQQFSAMNGEFNSLIEGIKNDMSLESGNILRNSSFNSNTHYWNAVDNISIINVGGQLLWYNANFYADKQNVADIYRDGNKSVLRIIGTTISQRNALFGTHSEGTHSVSFFYKVLRAGTLTAGIPGTDLYITETLAVNDSYEKKSFSGSWDGTGNFEIGFTGTILIYGVSLFPNELANETIKLWTRIYQNEEQIDLRATKQYVDSETGRVTNEWQAGVNVSAEQVLIDAKAWTNGILTNYATLSVMNNAINAKVADLNLGQYATTTWTSGQISNVVGSVQSLESTLVNNYSTTTQTANYINQQVTSINNNLSTNYSTTSQTATAITNAVSGKTSWEEVRSKLTQTSESFEIAFAHMNTQVTSITEAFYKFDSTRMYANRRIEVGSGSTPAAFVGSAGISPIPSDKGSNYCFLWAGSSFADALVGNSSVYIRHDGSGFLAKGGISWDVYNNMTFKSASSGERIQIDPNGHIQVLSAQSAVVFDVDFESEMAWGGRNSKVKQVMYRSDESILAQTSLNASGLTGSNYAGYQFVIGPGNLKITGMPQWAAAPTGAVKQTVYIDANTGIFYRG